MVTVDTHGYQTDDREESWYYMRKYVRVVKNSV